MNWDHARLDNRSAKQWLEDAARFEKMAKRFHYHPFLNESFAALAQDAGKRARERSSDSDLDYFRMRAAREWTAARDSADIRVRGVHLELAERYQALVRVAETASRGGPQLVS